MTKNYISFGHVIITTIIIHLRFYKFFEKNLSSDNSVVAFIFENAVISKSQLGVNCRHVRLKSGAEFDITPWSDSFSISCVNDAFVIRDLTLMKESFSIKQCELYVGG